METLHTTGLLRKQSSEGIGYSVADLNDVRHVFAAAVPRKGDTVAEQAHDALRTIEAVICEEGARGTIAKQSVFYSNHEHLEELKALIRDFYGPDLPATTYVPQHPCQGKLLAIEALGVGRGFGDVEIIRRNEQVVITGHDDISWVHCGQITPKTDKTSLYDRTLDCFRQMRAMLAAENVRFEQVIRTWLYIGDIVGPEGNTQRYMEVNRARTDFFKDYQFGQDLVPPGHEGLILPASTGIGADNRDIVMSCIGFVTGRGDIIGVSLENPRQTSAFDYDATYGQKSPKFSRAMALSCGRYATILVSGTASITDSETRHCGDVEKQTHETLDNIEALIAEENLARHGMPGHGAPLDGLAFVRVYIKRQEDYEKTRAVCEERLGELPTIYAVADVCRPELLVEIEGMAFSRRIPVAKPHFAKQPSPQRAPRA